MRNTLLFAMLFTVAAIHSAVAAKPADLIFVQSDKCLACHNGLITPAGNDVSIGSNWQSSMMAHAAKDPYWQASVRRESLDHPQAKEAIEDECSACHMPMSRYKARLAGLKGYVFRHLPLLRVAGRASLLAEDGVSCTMCHQIKADRLGTEESFTAGFVVDAVTPPGQRPVFGPYEIDKGRTQIMRSATRLVPSKSDHIQDSALCGSCHTLYTHARGAGGGKVGELPEQMPYLEWRHSAFSETKSCQSCHMPQLDDPMTISAVLDQPRENFSRHVFRGGNFLMPKIFNAHRAALGITAQPQDLLSAAKETERNLKDDAAELTIPKTELSGGHLEISLKLSNLAGHKLPTAYPSRRVWIHLKVTDTVGTVVFESGRLRQNGSIVGNDNDLDRSRFEPHHTLITSADQVQIYEPILTDSEGTVTTGLLSAVDYIKDNRILPVGFAKKSAAEDIAVKGAAAKDADFRGGGDIIDYRFPTTAENGPFLIEARLYYQPIGFRWARNLRQQQAEEIDRFLSYYDTMAEQSALVMTKSRVRIP